MPELPEVETVVRGLRDPLIGHTALGFWSDWSRAVRTPGGHNTADKIAGQTFRSIERRAKYILCHLDHDTLVVHLKMTGRLYVANDDEVLPADKWVHVRVQLDGGRQLRFSDARKFGFISLIDQADGIQSIAPTLGPEPLADEFTAAILRERLRGKRAIKAVLLDQQAIAGIGNIYADEALHQAHIHPLTTPDRLTDTQIAALHLAIRESLTRGIEREGASINWYRKPDGTSGSAQNHFRAYDQTGKPCVECGTPIEKIRVAQRGTHYCPTCQPPPE